MSHRLTVYVGSVIAAAAVILFLQPIHPDSPFLPHFLGWIVITVVAESLWLPTISGETTDSMASAANFATVVLWGVAPAVWIVWISTAISDLFIRRRPAIRVFFNAAAMCVVMTVAGWVFAALGGPPEGLGPSFLGNTQRPPLHDLLGLLIPLMGLGVVYRALNMGLVSVASGWSSDRPVGRVLREDFLYTEQIISDLALLFLSPLMMVSFLMLSYPGIILFYVPLLVIRDSHRRFVELRKAQAQLVYSERMAAKGEMAAEIGHELSGYLMPIAGRAQMLVLEAGKADPAKIERHARIIAEQAARMAIMTKGLMDFSYKEVKAQRVDLNDLVTRTVEFVRPQNKFDEVEFDLKLDPGLSPITADPGQLQQVFINLFGNAADAMNEKLSPAKRITVTTGVHEVGESVVVQVADTGPGMSRKVIEQIFDPTFTTKPTGHGFGLAACYRIVTDHRGRIWAESEVGRGAVFSVVLPIGAQAGW